MAISPWSRDRGRRVRALCSRALLVLLLRVLLLFVCLAALLLAGLVWHVQAATAAMIYAPTASDLPYHHAALVFGAGLTPQGAPSEALYDRVATAADLYRRHKVDKLLMTGDNSRPDYNEVEAMRRVALRLGVPAGDIVLDYAGFHTYDSCYRAHAVFGLADATLVTNAYHLPRALFTCAQLGVQGSGVVADRQYQPTIHDRLRELPALVVMQWGLLVAQQPHFLGPHVDIDVPQPQ